MSLCFGPRVRVSMGLCFGLIFYRQPGSEIPELMFYLVPIFSSNLFVITEAFHISYPDQTELVSYFLS